MSGHLPSLEREEGDDSAALALYCNEATAPAANVKADTKPEVARAIDFRTSLPIQAAAQTQRRVHSRTV